MVRGAGTSLLSAVLLTCGVAVAGDPDIESSPPRGVPMTRKKIEAIKREADRIESERRKIRNNKELMEELMQR